MLSKVQQKEAVAPPPEKTRSRQFPDPGKVTMFLFWWIRVCEGRDPVVNMLASMVPAWFVE